MTTSDPQPAHHLAPAKRVELLQSIVGERPCIALTLDHPKGLQAIIQKDEGGAQDRSWNITVITRRGLACFTVAPDGQVEKGSIPRSMADDVLAHLPAAVVLPEKTANELLDTIGAFEATLQDLNSPQPPGNKPDSHPYPRSEEHFITRLTSDLPELLSRAGEIDPSPQERACVEALLTGAEVDAVSGNELLFEKGEILAAVFLTGDPPELFTAVWRSHSDGSTEDFNLGGLHLACTSLADGIRLSGNLGEQGYLTGLQPGVRYRLHCFWDDPKKR